MRMVYFVHDVGDAAVARRLRMLAGVESLLVIGCRRGPAVALLEGRQVIDLGQTYDASFGQRIRALLRAWWHAGAWRPTIADADVVMARQLEMLLLAALTRPARSRLVYECLDIHRLMLGGGLISRVLRGLERALMRRCEQLVTSSDGFVSHYFQDVQGGHPPVLLLENKVLQQEIAPSAAAFIAAQAPRPPGPPWRIGWFGVLRCQRSLHLLASVAAAYPQLVEIVLRGRPSLTAIPDFAAVLAATPQLRFEGRYDRAQDLQRIYADVHFVWAVDWFEYPGNSEWLLPNRLYEGSVFGCVPIALRAVQTGRWLARHGCGLLLDNTADGGLPIQLAALDAAGYAAAQARVHAIPADALIDDEAACARLLRKLTHADGPHSGC